MRALRIAALGLLPLAAACWMERPNLKSTGGGYVGSAPAPAPAGAEGHAPAAPVEEAGPAAPLNPPADPARRR